VSTGAEIVVLLVMLIGVVGVLVPFLPGLVLVWAAGIAWVWFDGHGPAHLFVGVVLTGLLAVGIVAKYLLPARSASGAGAPRSTLLVGAAGAVVGFFVIPVVGLPVGGLAAVYLAELARLQDPRLAWRSTWAVLRGIGIGMLVELTAALLMVGVWSLGVLVT
jgi:uncharacterized protein YqgC (DUF456 family)